MFKTFTFRAPIILLLVVHFSCSSLNKNNFNIYGNIKGVTSGKVILAKLDLNTNQKIIVDSTAIYDGSFKFTGQISNTYLHSIVINDTIKPIHFFLEKGDMEIVGNKENIKAIGSREDSLFRSFTEDEIFEKEIGLDIMTNYRDYVFSAFVAYYQFQINQFGLDTMKTIINNFSENVKTSEYFIHVQSLLFTIESTTASSPAPFFTLPNVSGKNISLTDFRGKTILLDFWASWCAPCRAHSPDMVKLQNTFKDRNFTIVSISVDEDRGRWIKAIQDDGLNWPHLSNLDGWGKVPKDYGVLAVPQNFLVSPNGIILNKNLTIEQLTKRLEQLLP